MRSMPQRALQAPHASQKPVSVEIRAILPAAVSSHSMKPGTCSVITPPPAEVGGPQQGGLSLPSFGSSEQTVATGVRSASPTLRILLIVIGPRGRLFTCNMQSLLSAVLPHLQPLPGNHSATPANGPRFRARSCSSRQRFGLFFPPCTRRSCPV